jgi:hypothetical protein
MHKRPKFGKLGKDPRVATDFLPDMDRELQEEELRQQLKRVRPPPFVKCCLATQHRQLPQAAIALPGC